ncbi:MAG: hypothetical protein WCG55_03950 [bacterium]
MNEIRSKLNSSKKFLTSTFIFPINPRLQFRRLMIGGLILFIFVFLGHMYLFYKIESHAIFQSADMSSTSVPVVNETKLATVLLRFEDKAVIRSAALNLVPAVADPSK